MHFKAVDYIFIKPARFPPAFYASQGTFQVHYKKPAQVFMIYLIEHMSKERRKAAIVFNDKLDTFCLAKNEAELLVFSKINWRLSQFL